MSSGSDKKALGAVLELRDYAAAKTSDIRDQWRENFDHFVRGSEFKDKQDWQASFSVNELAIAIRSAAGGVRTNFLRRPDWFHLDGVNAQAKQNAPLLDKSLRFYLRKADFRRQANTFILMSMVSMGVMRIGFNIKRNRNPRLVIKESQTELSRIQKKLANKVENPAGVAPFFSEEDLASDLDQAIAELKGLAETGKIVGVEKKIPEFIQQGRLELELINPLDFYWEPDCQRMCDSDYMGSETWVPLYRLKEMERDGIYKNVSDIRPLPTNSTISLKDSRIRNTSGSVQPPRNNSRVKLLEWFGPLIIDDKVVEPSWHMVIANDNTVIKSQPSPFWADGYGHPYVTAAAHEIPFRATAQGLADGAIPLQRALDSNYHLAVDQMRLGLVGINAVDKTKVADPTIFMEGLEPGRFVETLADPEKVFKHFSLTSNIENQVFPMNEVIRQGIQKATGISGFINGTANLRSRTTAAEISQQSQGSESTLFTISEDLELQFLVPLLEKGLARVLQFGMDVADPEFAGILEPSELSQLQQLGATDLYNRLAQFYEFKISGFSSESQRLEEISRINELLAIYNTNGPVSQVLRGDKLIKDLVDKMGFKDPSSYVRGDSEKDIISSENQALMTGHRILPSPNDNDEMHIEGHQQAMMLPGGNSPEMEEHIQMHMSKLQQMQQAQQMQEAQSAPMELLDAPPPVEQLPPLPLHP